MAEHHHIEGNIHERYSLDDKTKKYLLGLIGGGLLLVIIGMVLAMSGGHDAGHGHGEHHGGLQTPVWLRQLFSNLLISTYFFAGIALLAVFFLAVKTVSNAGWYVVIKRVPEAVSEYLPVGLVFLGISLLGGLFSHSLYLWADETALKADHHYHVIKEKLGYLNTGFFVGRMLVIFALWILFQRLFMKHSYGQDNPATALDSFNASFKTGAIFLFVFAITMSVAAWDWFMSIVPAWFSTMFGVYIFASSWISFLAMATLIVIYLKKQGYMGYVTENHIHDLGKFVFAFSIFWTYIWFCEYLLIWYANIPEETFYFYNILHSKLFSTIFIGKFLINFILPFLVLMTRDAKRNMKTLAIVCSLVLFGHWLDLYIAVFPGTLTHEGVLGPMEIGMFMMFLGIFGYFVLNKLSQRSLVPEHHPYLEESLHHHVF